MFSAATKLTVIVEQLIYDQVLDLLYAHGAKGHTLFDGSGRGEHYMRKGGRAAVVKAFTIVQIDVVFGQDDQARAAAEKLAKTFFDDYAGIVYVSPVEIIRAKRF